MWWHSSNTLLCDARVIEEGHRFMSRGLVHARYVTLSGWPSLNTGSQCEDPFGDAPSFSPGIKGGASQWHFS